MASPYFQELEVIINSQFTGPINAYGGMLSTALRDAFLAGMVIWISLIAYEVAFGKSEDGATYLLTKIGKVFLIGAIAFLGFPMLRELLEGLQGIFMNASSIGQRIDQGVIDPYWEVFDKIGIAADAAWDKTDFYEVGSNITIGVVYAAMLVIWALSFIPTAIVAVVGFAMVLITQQMFNFLMALGPAFVLCLAFPFTRRFFENWIGGVMTTIFAAGLAVVLIDIAMNVLDFSGLGDLLQTWITNGMEFTDMLTDVAQLMLGKAISSALVIYLFFKTWDLASSLGGGVNMGNNMINGVRSVMQDMTRNKGQSSNRSTTQNQINAGRGGGASASSGRYRESPSTFTGMALAGAGAAGRMGAGAVRATAGAIPQIAQVAADTARGAYTVGRFAYNRGVKNFLK